MAKGKAFLIGRNARTGRLTKVSVARRRKATHTVERMPKRGRGDTR